MTRAKVLSGAGALGLVILAVSCQSTRSPSPAMPQPVARRLAPAPSTAPAPPAAPAPTLAYAVPPTGITTPMSGAPDAKQLTESRLVAGTCERNRELVEARIQRHVKAMRAKIDQQFAEWKELPRCEDRGITWDSASSASGFGFGGIGLSGIGQGGGGMGSGIGLGSVGWGRGTARAATAPTTEVSRARSASGTNNQVAGVDEADIVKNDGAYVYLASHGALRIAAALQPRLVSVTRLPGEVKELLVEGDRAVAFVTLGGTGQHACTYGYDCTFGGDGSRTKIVILDVKDRAHPRTAREIDLSGALLAARRIGPTVHAVVSDGEKALTESETWPAMIPSECHVKGMDHAAVRARFDALARENEKKIRAGSAGLPSLTERGKTKQLCEAMAAPLEPGDVFTSVISVDLKNDALPPVTAVMKSRPGAVFASENALYLTVRANGTGGVAGESSDVHKFRIGATPAETRYVGSGSVPGHVLNQFAMDEWYGYLRVATTRGHVPDPSAESAITVLSENEEGNLVRIGAIGHIAPGEDIRAVRFDADRGYVVTFKKTDPLFVIDLARPTAPQILGELKIPGFSTYIHRIDASHLLSIGFDADDHGDFAYFNGVILQLFDVSRPTEPTLLFKEKLGTRGSSSAAATDHLAFNYFDEKKLLAIPMTLCEGGGDGRYSDRLTFSGLLVYDVSLEGGFKKLGGVNHGKAGVSCGTWWSHATSAVKRSIFMDDLVFSIADDRMKVQRMGRFGEDVGDIPLAQ